MWRLTIRHIVWCLLQLDYLFVGKARAVMDDLHRVGRLADRTWALGRFGDLATVNVDANCVLTYGAFEES
jgi:hypothetical protein